jgi:hypothetical protein
LSRVLLENGLVARLDWRIELTFGFALGLSVCESFVFIGYINFTLFAGNEVHSGGYAFELAD